MKRLYFLITLCCISITASAIRYFPITVSAPYAGVQQVVCQGTTNTTTTVSYTVCATTSGGAGASLTVTPTWYLNGVVVYTGATFTSTVGGGTVTLPAAAFTYTTAGSFTGTNGLKCELSWTTAIPAGCVASPLMGSPTDIIVTTAPAAITGPATVCSGSTIALTDPTIAGTWTSSNTALATVVAGTGATTGVAAGSVTITYSTGCAPTQTKAITVVAAPSTISGTATVCAGIGTALSNTAAGGTWTSSNTAVASVSPTGGVTTGIVGIAIITYSTGCGTAATSTVTALGVPTTILGPSSVCTTNNISLSDAVTGGTWTTSNSTTATVASATGVVTGNVAGSVTITYSTGCVPNITKNITVVAPPGGITGPATVCAGSGINLTDVSVGGTWTSSSTTVGTVSATGAVQGVSQGTTTISYTTGCGTASTKAVTVIASPVSITGPFKVCSGATITLSDAAAGGTWTSGNSTVASVVSATRVVTGGSAEGTTLITHTTGCGSAITHSVTVVTPPSGISGVSSMCNGIGISLSNTAAGGTWSSSNTNVATISATGAVSSTSQGTIIITYTTGCNPIATKNFRVYDAPGPILGLDHVCEGFSVTVSNAATGGTWSSSSTSVAGITLSTGVINGLAAGNTTITYSTGCGIDETLAFITDPQPLVPLPITGINNVCVANVTTLIETVPGGVWSSSNTNIATVDVSGNVTGVSAGTVTVSYLVSTVCDSKLATITVTVAPPLAPPALIAGGTTACEAGTLTLSDATTGGAWSSSNTAIALVNTAGIVTGIAGGTVTISYTIGNSCGNLSATSVITVNPLPPAPGAISGYTAAFCAGTSITLSNPTPGGAWSSNTTTVAVISNMGVLTGVSGGNSTIYYSVSNGCGSVPVSVIVSVNALPVVTAITGAAAVCSGGTTTFSNATPGGTWSSAATSTAFVTATGNVTGLNAGSTIISYSVSNACGTVSVTKPITVNIPPFAGSITGPDNVCPAATIVLSNSVAGGIWSSDLPSTAIVTSAGVVRGLAPGPDTIRYSVSNVCGTTVAKKFITVLPCGTSAVDADNIVVNELKAYPNPNGGSFLVNLLSGTDEPVTIVITNVTGAKVKELCAVTNKEIAIAMDQPAGLYFISAVTAHGVTMVKVMVSK